MNNKFKVGEYYEYKSRYTHMIFKLLKINGGIFSYKPVKFYYKNKYLTYTQFSFHSLIYNRSILKNIYNTKLYKLMNE